MYLLKLWLLIGRGAQGTSKHTVGRLMLAGALALLVPHLVGAQPTTTRASVASGGAQSNGESWISSVSADGRWVAFQSLATSLVTGDTNGAWDVFVHDQQTSTTTRVGVGPGGIQGNGLSLSSRDR